MWTGGFTLQTSLCVNVIHSSLRDLLVLLGSKGKAARLGEGALWAVKWKAGKLDWSAWMGILLPKPSPTEMFRRWNGECSLSMNSPRCLLIKHVIICSQMEMHRLFSSILIWRKMKISIRSVPSMIAIRLLSDMPASTVPLGFEADQNLYINAFVRSYKQQMRIKCDCTCMFKYLKTYFSTIKQRKKAGLSTSKQKQAARNISMFDWWTTAIHPTPCPGEPTIWLCSTF